jgi:hypothetical protein
MTKTPQELYKEREQRVLDVLALKKPDQVPAIILFGCFASRYAGISRKDGGYIMSAAAVLDDAKIDNVRVMMDCTREF